MNPALRAFLLAGALYASALPAAEHVHDRARESGEHARPSLYSAADLRFLTHMIVHHQQALDLCALVPERSRNEQFRRFARLLNDAQQAEMDHMRALLRLAEDRGAVLPPSHLHGDPPMEGMLSSARMQAISQARDQEFERLWLEGMILHHQGAVDMALAQQEAQFRNGNQPWGVDVLVDEMLAAQRDEIARMRDWLARPPR